MPRTSLRLLSFLMTMTLLWPRSAHAEPQDDANASAGSEKPATQNEGQQAGAEATQGEGHEAGHEGHHHEHHHRYHVGFTGVALAGFDSGGESTHLGVGLFFELSVIPGWLEIELGTRVVSADTGVEMPIDLLIKKPFHVNKWFHPFVGLGPSLVPTFLAAGNSFHAGGASTVGAHFWITSDLALVAEVNYNLLYDHGLVNEAGGAAGLVVGW